MAVMGRPKLETPKKNRVTVRFDDKEFQKLQERAEKNNHTVTEIIRNCVEEMLNS